MTKWENDNDKNSNRISVPSHFKKYTMENQKILLQQQVLVEGMFYDLPMQAKINNLIPSQKEPRPTKISQDFTLEEESSNTHGVQGCVFMDTKRFKGGKPRYLSAHNPNKIGVKTNETLALHLQ